MVGEMEKKDYLKNLETILKAKSRYIKKNLIEVTLI